MTCPGDDTLLDGYTENIRRQWDNALLVNSQLKCFKNVTVHRYSIKETDMKDETKTLLETVTGVVMYLDYPGDITNLSSNTPFIEDVLPVMAMFPWYHKNKLFKVDIKDEFEFVLKSELDKNLPFCFEITDRVSTFEQNHVERSFITVPKRVSTVDLTDKVNNEDPEDETPDGIPDDPNWIVDENSIYSDYD